ncbi:lariat debranching enzyme [Lingula anatina]|uniref:Lariat debranching enzyme n=1 Tax=Lingula anatina TaxID=7574 RepID=A0A1S3I668_LINAN|nr:lariat debranching enzyme [Lingula anatina]|eukprot:XP_013393703.1 lariat debranching enzyme [Lingula anatina]
MKIAIEGCCHGELDKIYETIEHLSKKQGIKIDLLLICGDFQAVRNTADLQCMAVPPKYQQMNTFYKYYGGIKAPIPTVFIGGNHEASNYLQELPYGGWVAPNIYYMGYASVLRFGGVRIAGLSGIYKSRDYARGHFEKPPYTENTKRSAYHVRNVEVFRLKQLSTPVDICMSHDWPRGVYYHGNTNKLLMKKKFFKEEVENNTLGSPPAEELLHKLKPNYWFSAHLHVKFPAVVEHKVEGESSKTTKFLALDKCLPGRDFLQILDIPHDPEQPLVLQHDAEWLAILKSTNHLTHIHPTPQYMPGPGCDDRYDFTVTQEELDALKEDFGGDFAIPENFEPTVPVYDPNQPKQKMPSPQVHINPQTTLLCTMLDITDPNAALSGKSSTLDIDELEEVEEDEEDSSICSALDTTTETSISFTNPDEIALDDLEEDDTDSGIPDLSSNAADLSAESGQDSPKPLANLSFDSDSASESTRLLTKMALPAPKSSEDGSTAGSCDSDSAAESLNPKTGPNTELKIGSSPLRSLDSSNADSDSSSSPSTRRPLDVGEVSHAQGPSVKKFKRRNQAMYSGDDDEAS